MKNIQIIAILLITTICGYYIYQSCQQKKILTQAPCLPGYIISENDTCVKS